MFSTKEFTSIGNHLSVCGQASTKKVPPVFGITSCYRTGYTATFYRSQAITRAQLAQHAVDMVLHGLLGKIELGSDLFIGKTAADHLHQLLLATSQAQIMFEHEGFRMRRGIDQLLEQRDAQGGRTTRFSVGYGADACSHLHCRGLFQYVPHNAVTHGLQECFPLGFHTHHYYLDVRHGDANLRNQTQLGERNCCGIAKQDMWGGGDDLLNDIRCEGRCAYDPYVALLVENPCESFAQKTVLSQNKDLHNGNVS